LDTIHEYDNQTDRQQQPTAKTVLTHTSCGKNLRLRGSRHTQPRAAICGFIAIRVSSNTYQFFKVDNDNRSDSECISILTKDMITAIGTRWNGHEK